MAPNAKNGPKGICIFVVFWRWNDTKPQFTKIDYELFYYVITVNSNTSTTRHSGDYTGKLGFMSTNNAIATICLVKMGILMMKLVSVSSILTFRFEIKA